MIIYVGGIPGVGKTTIITRLEKIAQKTGFKLEQTRGLDIFCKLAGVATVEELRLLPEETRSKFRPEMYRRLYAMDREDLKTMKVADGHFCFFDTKGEKYGVRSIQPWDKEQILFIVTIVANSKTILKRRLKDFKKRTDRQFRLEFIKMEQRMELDIAFSQAKELEIPIEILINEDGKSVEISKTLLRLIKNYANKIHNKL